jgi:hypothetical protein
MMVVCDGLFWFWDVVLGKKEEVGGLEGFKGLCLGKYN